MLPATGVVEGGRVGLVTHPYYVVTDLLNRLESNSVPKQCGDSVLGAIRAEHHGHENTLHCLLRVGKPVGEI